LKNWSCRIEKEDKLANKTELTKIEEETKVSSPDSVKAAVSFDAQKKRLLQVMDVQFSKIEPNPKQ